jgi:hypothetical protein
MDEGRKRRNVQSNRLNAMLLFFVFPGFVSIYEILIGEIRKVGLGGYQL